MAIRKKIEIESNIENASKDVGKLEKSFDKLNETIDKMSEHFDSVKSSIKEFSEVSKKSFGVLSQAIKLMQSNFSDTKGVIGDVGSKGKKELGKVEKSSDKVNKSLKKTNKELKNLGKTSKVIGVVKKGFLGLRSAIVNVGKGSKSATKGIKGIAGGLKGVGVALKAAGIGLVISAFVILKEIMMKNQKVVDLVSTAFESISTVVNTFVSAIYDAVQEASNATNGFDKMKKVIGGLITIALTPLKLNFYSLKRAFLTAQLAWEESFLGDNDPETVKRLTASIAETDEAIIQLGKDAYQAGIDITENIGGAIEEGGALMTSVSKKSKEAYDNMGDVWSDAERLTQLRKDAKEAKAINDGIIEQAERDAELQRQIRDDETLGLSVRLAANEKLKEILEKQGKSMQANADKAVELAKAELAANDNDENKLALKEAINQKAAIENRITGQISEQKTNQVALEKELAQLQQSKVDAEMESAKAIAEAKIALIDDEIERLDAQEKARTEAYNREMEDMNARLQSMRDNNQEETQAYVDLQNKKLEADTAYGIQKEAAEKRRQQLTLKREEDIEKAKIGLAKNGLQVISALATEGSALQKALAVSGVLFTTYEAVMSAFNAGLKSPLTPLFPAFPYVQAGLAGAFGLTQLKALQAEQAPSAGGGGGGTGGAAAAAVSQPDLVGLAANNSLSNIDANSGNPIRAYVTSSDVSTAIALERSAVSRAKLGG